MVPDTKIKLFKFISEECGVEISELSDDTTLLWDLGLDGDDAVEFFENFSEQFDVDLSEFEIYKYFGPEWYPPHVLLLLPLYIGLYFIRHYLFGKVNRKLGFIPITIADLLMAAKTKKWQKLE